ncbi:MAG: R2-like ligand-binding oxidase [Anaerolineae bacterium]
MYTLLRHDAPAMRDYHKAKRLLWDPRDVDLNTDSAEWPTLTQDEQDLILRLCSVFAAGEEAVTCDLAPLMLALRGSGGSLEEQMFVTTQLFEEAKHVEMFDRYFAEVFRTPVDTNRYYTDSYRRIFFAELPQALDRLLTDPSPQAQVTAVATYHMIVEGVLAETGYYATQRALQVTGRLPGLVQAMQLIQRDEARHIAFGISLLHRLVSEDAALWDTLMERMNELLPVALEIIADAFAPYGEAIPFGIAPVEMVEYGATQFNHRLNALERGRA